MLSDSIKQIGARLVLNEDTQTDGRTLLAYADEAATMESRLAEIDENEADYLLELNDFLNATRDRSERIARRLRLPVDGQPADYPTR